MVKTINTIQAATILNCSQRLIQNLCRSKKIKSVKNPMKPWEHPAHWEIDLNSLLSYQHKDHELADSYLTKKEQRIVNNYILKLQGR